MEGAYFVGRKEILDWVNTTCSLSLTKVEDTASGCAACMLLDQLHPGTLSMAKVNWNAKQSFEFVGNYKLLQTAFTKLKIDRHIDVDRLISGRYMDNLEFMQWFKRFYELGNGSTDRPAGYDAVEARCKGKGGSTFTKSAGVTGQGQAMKRTGSAPETSSGPSVASESTRADKKKIEEEKKRRSAVATEQDAPAASKRETSTAGGGAAAAKAKGAGRLPKELPATPGSPGNATRLSSSAAIVANKALLNENGALKAQNESLRSEMVGLEKERDFYFDKLRDIEILLQDMEEEGSLKDSQGANSLSAKMFKILYATADGFVQSPSAASATAAAVNAVSPSVCHAEDLPISPMKLKYNNNSTDDADLGGEDEHEAVPPPPAEAEADDEEEEEEEEGN